MNFKEYCELTECSNLYEGINVDVIKRTVTFDDSHEDFVDTSYQNNPTQSNRAISIFKRKKSNIKNVSDGNPLVYALKGQKKWSISDEDKKILFTRISEILKKVSLEFDVIVVPPSSSELNKLVADMVLELNQNAIMLNHCLLKRRKEEVLDDIEWSVFTPEEMDTVADAMSEMGEFFESKRFPKDSNLISKFETSIFKIDPKVSGADILDKRVLVVDDIVSTGMSLSKCAQTINEHFFSKSIQNLVLFSEV